MKRLAILATIAIALAAGIMIYPVTYRMQAECRLQPALRRTISVPFDSTLVRSHVRPGDAVTKDQLLAELDGREIRMQLAEAKAALNAAIMRRDNAMVAEDAPNSQIVWHLKGHERGGQLSVAKALRCRIRYFCERVAFGGAEFVEQACSRLSTQREHRHPLRPRPIPGSRWEDLRVANVPRGLVET